MSRHAASPTSRVYFSQRLRLHYVDWGQPAGKPEAPPLVLLHGGQDHCRNWDWVAEALRRDYRIIAPDLRGHGDSAWTSDGSYTMAGYVYDLAQLIHQLKLAPARIIAHSLGGNIALRYAGIHPENVQRLVAIEGLGPSPKMVAEERKKPMDARMREWMEAQRKLAGRQPRRYPTVEDAFARMRGENTHLGEAQARHLTEHGVNQNEDGTFSWKFDNYVRSWPPYDMPRGAVEALWGRISCPTLLVYGGDSWASNPEKDGRIAHFRNARVVEIPGASHWVHHDRLDAFLAEIGAFL